MATYARTTWVNGAAGGTPLNDDNLNNLEAGLDGLYDLWAAKGGLVVASAASAPIALTVGANDTVLVADSAQAGGVKWANINTLAVPLSLFTAKGDLVASSASGTVDNLAVGTNGQVLTAASGETLGMEWAAVAGAATVATTVAGLGTGTAGKLGLLRVGTTPFAFVPLTYDATYAKWVSPQWTVGSMGYFEETSTSVVERAGFSLPDYKAHTDAGLTLMLRLFAFGQRPGGAATTTTVRVYVDEWNGDGPTIVAIDVNLIQNVLDSTIDYVLSAWTAAGAAASQPHGMVRILSFIAPSGTGIIRAAHVVGRWEAASA